MFIQGLFTSPDSRSAAIRMNAAKPSTHRQIQDLLIDKGDAGIAAHSQRFFKTGAGQYGENDRFLGIRVPELRKLVKSLRQVSLPEIRKLLKSPFHEARLMALLMLVDRYEHGTSSERDAVFECYITHTAHINNWDLVDASAHRIVGPHLEHRDRTLLFKFAQSTNLWERRIAIFSSFHFIKRNDFADTLNLSKILLEDEHDLIHKVVGWMLREVGKRDKDIADKFLTRYYREMLRTMLRYAIEKHPEEQRQAYLKGLI